MADAIGSWVRNPAVDFSFAPASAVDADPQLRRERPFGDFPIDGRAGQAGPVENGFEADDTVWFGHVRGSMACVSMAPPANNVGHFVPPEKDVSGESKCSEEISAHGGLDCIASLDAERRF